MIPALRQQPASRLLLSAYAVLLLSIPSDIGIDAGSFVLSPQRVLLALAALAATAEILRRPAGDRLGLPREIVIAWAAFIGIALASGLLNPSPGGLSRVGSLVAEGAFVFGLAWHVGRDPLGDRSLDTAIVVTTAVVAAVTIGLALVGQRYDQLAAPILGEGASAPPLRLGLERQQGPFDAPLFYGVWLVAASALVLPRIEMASGARRPRWLAAWGAMVAAVLSTLSRIALVGVPLVAAAYLAGRGQTRRAAGAFVVAVVLGLAVFVAPLELGFSDGPGSLDPGTGTPPPPGLEEELRGSNQARIEALRAAIAVTAERPLLGWGPLTAVEVASEELGHRNFMDNAYLVLVVEYGILGLAAFLALLAVVIAPAVRAIRDPIVLGRLVACLSLLAMAGFVALFAVTQAYAAFWLVAGLLAVRTRAVRRGEAAQAPGPPVAEVRSGIT